MVCLINPSLLEILLKFQVLLYQICHQENNDQ